MKAIHINVVYFDLAQWREAVKHQSQSDIKSLTAYLKCAMFQ